MKTPEHDKNFIEALARANEYNKKRKVTDADKKRQQEDRHAEPRCPYCDDNHCGGWCG